MIPVRRSRNGRGLGNNRLFNKILHALDSIQQTFQSIVFPQDYQIFVGNLPEKRWTFYIYCFGNRKDAVNSSKSLAPLTRSFPPHSKCWSDRKFSINCTSKNKRGLSMRSPNSNNFFRNIPLIYYVCGIIAIIALTRGASHLCNKYKCLKNK